MKKRAILRLRAFRLFLKTSKYGSLAIFLAIIILGGLTVWAVVPGEKIETLEAYPAKAVSGDNEDFGSGAGWSNLNNALGRPDALSNGKIENFSDANSATYKAGSSNLIVSNFLEEERNASGYYENKNFLSAKIKFSFATGEKKADLEIRGNENLFVIQNAKADENKENFIDSAEDEIISASPEAVSNFNDAGNLPNIDAKIIVWYSLDGEIWWKLDTISSYYLSNALNGGYFSFDTPLIKNWDDIKNLKIKFEGVVGGETTVVSYLDSVWVEVSYKDSEKDNADIEEKKSEIDANSEEEIKSISDKKDFKRGEEPELKFHYQKKQGIIAAVGEVLGINSDEEKIKSTARITNPKGETEDVLPEEIIENNGDISVKLKKDRAFQPGLYKVILEVDDQGAKKEITRDFTWGVLAINTNKSVYLPEEKAYIQMGVLNDDGHTVCDASLKLEIRNPKSETKILTTEDGTIERSGKCSGDNVTDVPDYFAHYQVGEAGIYEMILTRIDPATNEKISEITDSFEVKNSVPFEVERIGPTRIWPMAPYDMAMKIKANQDFSGEIAETVPEGFEIKYQVFSIKYQGQNEYQILDTKYEIQSENNATKRLIWKNIALKQNEEIEVKYTFDAPDISPYIYLLGQLSFIGADSANIFQEVRQWQIASDAVLNWVLHRPAETIDSVPNVANFANASETAAEGSTDTSSDVKFGSTTGYYVYQPGVQNTATGTPGSSPAGFGWWTANPYLNSSVSANWTFVLNKTDNRSGAICKFRIQVFGNTTRSTTGATLLFNTGDLATDACTSSTATVSQTFNPGALNLTTASPANTAKYLLFEVWVDVTTAGTSASHISLNVDGTSTTAITPEGANTFAKGANITGTVYSDEGTTAITSGPTVGVRKNGAVCTGCSDVAANGSGVYIMGIETPASADTVTIFLNTNGGALGNMVMTYSPDNTAAGGKNMTGQNIYQNRVIAMGTAAGNVSNANFAQFDNDNDTDMLFTANGAPAAYVGEAGSELHIWTGSTYAPAGDVSTPDLHIQGTYTGASETLTLSGSGAGACTSAPGTIRPLCIDGGTFTSATNTTIFAGTAASNIETAASYYTLNFSPASGTPVYTTNSGTLTVGANWSAGTATALNTNNTIVTLTGDLSGAGSITQGTGLMTIGGSWLNTGTFTASSAGVTLTGASKQITGPAGGITFTTLTVNGTYTNNNAGTVTVSTALSGAGTLTQGTNSTLAISGTSGITGLDATTNMPNTVNYNSSGAQTVKPVSYHNLTLSNAGAKTMTSVTSIMADLTISGSATMTSNAGFTVGGALNYSSSGATTLTAATAISIGTYNQSNGTFTDNGNTITVTGTGVSTWTKSAGTFTTSGTTIFTGAAPQIGASNFNNLTINVGAGNTATLAGSATVAGDLSISTGKLDLGAYTANRTVAGGTLTVSNGATLKIGGIGTLPANYNTHSVGATSTVEYAGTTTTVAALNSSQNYGNLTITGSGVTTSASFSVATALSDTGSLIASAGTITMNSGSSISNSGTLTFYNLTIPDSATVTSTGNFAVAGIFTVGPTTAATFTPSAADVISGAGTLTGYGTVQVTRTTATADFSSQYAITTKTLTNLTVEYAGASAQTVSSITYGHLKINMAGQAATLGGAITVNGNLTIAAGTLDTGNTLNYGIIVKGNWSNSGTFTARAGTVTFNGTGAQSISGANTWYGLAVTASAARTVSFQSSVTQTIAANGSLTFTGALGQLLTLAPVTAATNWLLSVNNTNVTQSISYVSVSYSDATGVAGANTAVNATNGTNSGTFTTNWNFTLGITVSGNAYADEGTTVWAGCNGTDARISLVVNGGTAQTASCNGGTGAYSFSNVTVALNNPVSIFFNTAGANTDKGVVVTIAKDATTAITVNPRKNIVWVTAENSATSVTNANLNHCDSDSPAQCANVPYAVDVSSNLTVADGAELHIETSKTFAPTGTVTTSPSSVAGDRDGDIHIAGTFSVGTYAVSVGGDWNNVGTFSKTNPQTTTFTATGTGFNINTGGSNFNNIVFNGASGGWTAITNTFTVDGTLTITAGNFDTGAVANAITGATGVTGTLTHSSATGAKTFTGDVTVNAGGVWNETAAAAINFGGSLTNNATTWTGSTGTHTFTGTTKTISGSTIITIPNISVSGTVTNSGTMAVSTTLAGAGGFTNGNGVAGTLNFGGTSIGVTTFTASAASNTVVYNGVSATSVRAATYDTLTVGAANSANVAYTALGNITANNNINLQSAALTYVNTFDLDNYNLTVGSAGVANSGGIAVPARSTFIQDGGTTTVKSSSAGSATIGGAGTATFWNLTVGAASDNTTYNFNLGGAIAVSNDLTVTAAGAGTHTLDVTASNYGLTVGGSWTNNSTFAKQGGTVTFGSGWSYKKALVLSGVNLTDYQVKFTVYQGNGTDDNATNTVYCNGKCRVAAASPNGYGDVRFADAGGNQLSYWIEDPAANPAIIWVKVPTVVSGGTTIYMLYGNSSATTTSNGANTFISFLNFENTIEGFDGGTSTTAQYKFDSYSFDLASANRHKAIAMPTKPFTLMMWVRPSGTTQNSTLQFENTYNTDGAYIGTNYGFAGKWVYYDAGWKSTGISFAARWYKIELVYGTSAYDIIIDGSTVVTGAAYTTAAAVNGYQLSSDAAFYIDGLIQRKSAATEPTKAWGSETFRTIADGGSSFFNIIFNDSGNGAVWLYQDGASIAPNQTTVQNGTPTYLNAKTGTVSVTGGTLNVDWYLGVHAVDAANTATDIDTAANDIAISENSGTPASTVWRYDGTSWGSAATSQTTDTAASGKNSQPAAAGAIRIREYSKTSAAAAYYSYNLKINWVLQGGTNYGEYDYYADYGGNYLTSSANPAAGDKTISVSWYRSASGTMNGLKEYDGVNNPPTQGSWYLGMLNGLSFSIDSFSVNFGNIDPGASPSDAANTLTVSTSATNGYVITAWSSAAMTCSDAGACGTAAIADWGGTNASPVTWPAGSYGFGYSTNDITLTGGTANRFSGPNFAGFVHSGAGDPVADRSNTECPCNNQTNVITYRIAAGATQRPGPYSATIIYVLTAQY